MKYQPPTERTLPQSLEAERAVLGAMLLSPIHAGTTARNALSGVEFSQSCNMVIFSTIGKLIDEGKTPDLIMVTQRLQDTGCLADVGGPAYLAQLLEASPTTSNIDHYLQIVLEKATRRTLIGLAHDITEKAHDQTTDIEQTHSEACSAILRVGEGGEHVGTSADAVKEYLEMYERLTGPEAAEFRGIETGFAELDNDILGLEPGKNYIVGARPSIGKSAYAGQVASHCAGNGHPVGIITLEQKKRDWVERMIAARTRLNQRYPKTHTAYQREANVRAAMEVQKLPIYYDDRKGLTLSQIRSSCRAMKARYGCRLFIIDHILLIGNQHGDRRTRHAQLTEASAAIAELTQQLDAPFMVLAQLSRDVEKNERPPRLSDLKECGDIEQNADVVLLMSAFFEKELKSPAKKFKGVEAGELKRIRRFTIAKQRGGVAGSTYNRYQTFEEEFTLFRDVRYPDSTTEPETDWREGPSE